MKLAFTFLCENPCRQTALTTFFREYLEHSLHAFADLEWLIFAGPNHDLGFEHPRLEFVRAFPANDRVVRRLLADHFQVAPLAKRRGARALLTIGFVPLRAPLPVFMHINSLQHLSNENNLGGLRQWYRCWNVSRGVRKAAMVLTNSQFAASQLRRAHPECAAKLVVTHEGTQREYSPQRAPGETEALQRELGIEPGYLLWVSNFYHYKQAPLFLEAYADLPPEIRRRLPVIMTGGDWDGGLAAAQAVIRARSLEENVRILGWIDFKWLPPLYRHALAYVLPSREETFGRTTTEALASGTPCVLHDIPIMHEIAGDSAIIVDFRDRAQVTAVFRRLFEDDALRRRLSAAGIERAGKFSFARMATERVQAVLNWLKQQQRSEAA